jgi:hypothetical protein
MLNYCKCIAILCTSGSRAIWVFWGSSGIRHGTSSIKALLLVILIAFVGLGKGGGDQQKVMKVWG